MTNLGSQEFDLLLYHSSLIFATFWIWLVIFLKAALLFLGETIGGNVDWRKLARK